MWLLLMISPSNLRTEVFPMANRQNRGSMIVVRGSNIGHQTSQRPWISVSKLQKELKLLLK